ncbi:MAG: hypothetical protein LC130_08200 [Bryobacterales bacterium]|nr:hypothetical protein [Bryobacterales bacterium]MEB2360352.1 hypothetical protein [Bryobacterales bacterium]
MKLSFLVMALGMFAVDLFPQAAAPDRLQNTGKPMRLPFECSEEQVRTLGLSCSVSDPCTVYLELSEAAVAGAKIFLTGNIHNTSTTISSVLLASEDSGASWFEPHERILSAGLEKIQFLDPNSGWAGGQLLLATPRDPFFLLTTDGGTTWRKRAVFGESRIGIIEQFWFDTRTSGVLLIDRLHTGENGARHELYESMTGGDSWMLRQVSTRPIPVKHIEVSQPAIRIRADATSKSYHVERRQGDGWRTIARFLVQIGECKPEHQDMPPPPPPEEPGVPEPSPSQAAPRTSPPPSLRKP